MKLLMALLLAAMFTTSALACGDRPLGLVRVGDEVLVFADRASSNWVVKGFKVVRSGKFSALSLGTADIFASVERRKVVVDRNTGTAQVVSIEGTQIFEGSMFQAEECTSGRPGIVVITEGLQDDERYWSETIALYQNIEQMFTTEAWASRKDDGNQPFYLFGRHAVTFQSKSIAQLKADGYTFDPQTAELVGGGKRYLLLNPTDLDGRFHDFLTHVYVRKDKKTQEYILETYFYEKGTDVRQPNRFYSVKQFRFKP